MTPEQLIKNLADLLEQGKLPLTPKLAQEIARLNGVCARISNPPTSTEKQHA